MITYFKDKNQKSEKKYENYKTLNTKIESADTIVTIGSKSTSTTLSITVNDLIVLSISAGIACTLSLDNKVLQPMIMNKFDKYRNNSKKDQEKIKSFDKLYRKSLQDMVIFIIEYECFCNISTK